MTRAPTRLALLLWLLGSTSTLGAQVPPEIFGVYTRSTPTCGFGPGGADRQGSDCIRQVYEDKLEITSASESVDRVRVIFALHFNVAQNEFCVYRGEGTWSNGVIALGPAERPLEPKWADPKCQLSLSFSKNSVQVSDDGNRCALSLCNGQTELDGISYKR